MTNQEVKVKYGVTGADEVEKKTSKLHATLSKLGSLLRTGVIAAFAALATAVGLGIKEISEGEKVTAKLNQALVNTGKYTKETSKALQDYANSMQKKVAFDDESIIAAEASFAAFGLEKDQIMELTKATADLAQAKGMDLAAAADLVSKSVGSSTNAMSRYGISITGAAGSTERISGAIAGLNQLFGGQAEAFGQTFPGQVAIFKNEVMNTAGSFTQYLMPAFTKGIELANKLLQSFSSFVGSSGMAEFMTKIGNAFNIALEYIRPFWESLKEAASQILPKVISVFTSIWNILVDVFKILENLGVGGVVKTVFDLMLKGAEAFWTVLEKIAKGIEWVVDGLAKMTGKKVSVETSTKNTTTTEGGVSNSEQEIADLQAAEERKTEILNEQNALRMENQLTARENQLTADAEFKEILQGLKDEENTAEQEAILLEDEAYRARKIAELEFYMQNEQQKVALKSMTNAQIAALDVAVTAKTKQQSEAYIGYVAKAAEEEKNIGLAVAKGTLEYFKDMLKQKILAKSAELVAIGWAEVAATLGAAPQGWASIAAGGALAATGVMAVNSINLAEGGSMIVDSPTRIGNNVLAGEAGPERIDVTPLGQSQPITVNNAIYLDGELITTQVVKTSRAMESEGTL